MPSEFFRRHKAGLLLTGFVAFSFICLTNRVDSYVLGIKSVAWYLISPEVVYSGSYFNQLDSLKGRLFQLARAEGENHILREQNSQLAKRELERDAIQNENDRLRKLLNLKEKAFSESIAAEVVGHDVRDWFYSILINKGQENQILVSAAVVAGTGKKLGLVGRVAEVYKNNSKVLLISDPISAVSVSNERTGSLGLLFGQNQPQLLVRYIPYRSQLAVGDMIKTAGLSGVFPPGIPVGKIKSFQTTADGFFKEAVVEPILDFGSLHEVLVMSRQDQKSTEVSE